jgi:glycosyltransferase involved in cell wall biosynthesis
MAYLKRFHNQTLFTMVPTQGLANKLSGAGFERLQVVARGVDAAQFDPQKRSETLRASWGATPNTPVILCVGRLAKEKNLQLLIRAYAQIKLMRPEVKLVLVGDGPMRSELQAQVPDAIFTGNLTGQILAAHYASADIFGFASQSETFGNVVLEAMASGLGVVAFDYACAADNIDHRVNGLLVPLDKDDAFVDMLIELSLNAGLQEKMRYLARNSALNCDWSSIIEQIEQLLLQVKEPIET